MRTIALLVLLAACSKEDGTPAKAVTRSTLAHASATDFARELDAAEQRGTWLELRRRWQGQKLRWTVYRPALLCGSAAACNVRAFPTQQPATHGWLPELHFAPGQYEALAAKCGDADQCEVTIEGTLAKLEANGDTPTNLKFEGVIIAQN